MFSRSHSSARSRWTCATKSTQISDITIDICPRTLALCTWQALSHLCVICCKPICPCKADNTRFYSRWYHLPNIGCICSEKAWNSTESSWLLRYTAELFNEDRSSEKLKYVNVVCFLFVGVNGADNFQDTTFPIWHRDSLEFVFICLIFVRTLYVERRALKVPIEWRKSRTGNGSITGWSIITDQSSLS